MTGLFYETIYSITHVKILMKAVNKWCTIGIFTEFMSRDVQGIENYDHLMEAWSPNDC